MYQLHCRLKRAVILSEKIVAVFKVSHYADFFKLNRPILPACEKIPQIHPPGCLYYFAALRPQGIKAAQVPCLVLNRHNKSGMFYR